MTLIAAFRCQGGLVLAADSQETIIDDLGNEYRKTVQKISPRKIGSYEVAFAGAGNAGLIEALILQFEAALADDTSLTGIKAFRKFAEKQIRQFYEDDVRLCPDADKGFIFFIAAASPSTQEFEGWITEQTRLRPIALDKPELIGVEYGLYTQTARRLFVKDMMMSQAILASIYVLNLAEQTSNWVRGPMSVVAVKGNGVWEEKPEHVKRMQDRISEYEQQINAIFLACADTSIPVHKLHETITDFSEVALALHRQHIDTMMHNLSLHDVLEGDGYPKHPIGVPIYFSSDGSLTTEHDPVKAQAMQKEFREVREWLKKQIASMRCSKCGNTIEIPTRVWPPKARTLFCPTCNERTSMVPQSGETEQ